MQYEDNKPDILSATCYCMFSNSLSQLCHATCASQVGASLRTGIMRPIELLLPHFNLSHKPMPLRANVDYNEKQGWTTSEYLNRWGSQLRILNVNTFTK